MSNRTVSKALAVVTALGVSIAGTFLLVSAFRPSTNDEIDAGAQGDYRLALSAILMSGSEALDSEIFVVTSGGVSPITSNDSADIAPVWSPDGELIAFASDRDEAGNLDIYVMNRDGSGAERLTTSPEIDTRPSWSPSGDAIAFARHDGKDTFELWTVTLEGTETRLTENSVDDFAPAWSPGGQHIAFQRYVGENLEIFLVDADGHNEARVTALDGEDSDPAWSPDGTAVVFTRDPLEDSQSSLAIQSALSHAVAATVIQTPDGTFPRDAQWLSDGSILATELMPDHGVRLLSLNPDNGDTKLAAIPPEATELLESAWRVLGIDAWGSIA